MTPDDRERLKQLFEAAIERPPAERQRFIEEGCAGDEALQHELEYLVEHHQRASEEFLKHPLIDPDEILPLTEEARLFDINSVLLNRFRIVRFLGRGGMGDVYEAEDLELREKVALKTIRPHIAGNPQSLTRFKKEIQLAKRVTDKHVCRIHDLFIQPKNGSTPGAAFLTMEYLAGPTLASKIKAEGGLAPGEANSVALQLCSALQTAHEAGVIHRDLKSGNIMLDAENSGAVRAVVTDFGLARDARPSALAVGSGVTRPGVVIGTPAYMAPEQFEGRPVSPATDIFALGVVLFEMVTGKLPFTGNTPIAAALQRGKQPPSVSSVKPGLDLRWDTVIRRCLEYEPERRYQSAAEVAEALQSKPTESKTMPFLSAQFFRRPNVGLLACLILLCLTAGGFLLREWIAGRFYPLPAEKHLAVLPFMNVGGDPSNKAFCEGVVETLTAKLSQLEQFQKSFWIVPSSEVRKIGNASDAYRALKVTLVVTGSMQRLGGRVRLIANLIDAGTLKQLASRTIDADLSELPELEDRTWERVADMLQLQLAPEAKRTLTAGGTRVPGAYEFYEQGIGYLERYGVDNFDRAIDLFKKALEKDSLYALAYAGLGEAYLKKFEVTKDPSLVDPARTNAMRALALDDKLAPVHVTLGQVYNRTGQHEAAVREFRRTLEVNPTSTEAHYWLGRTLDDMGKLNDAEAAFKNEIELRPSYWQGYSGLGFYYYRHGQYSKAEPLLRTMIQLAPDISLGYENLGGVYLQMGRYEEAVAILKKSLEIKPTATTYTNLGAAHILQGHYREAVPMMEQAVRLNEFDHRYWRNLGDAYRMIPEDARKAPEAYRRAVDLARKQLIVRPNDPVTRINLALYLAKLGDSTDALTEMAKALKAGPSEVEMLFKAALIYELVGKRSAAINALRSAVRGGYSTERIDKEPELARLRTDPRYRHLTMQ